MDAKIFAPKQLSRKKWFSMSPQEQAEYKAHQAAHTAYVAAKKEETLQRRRAQVLQKAEVKRVRTSDLKEVTVKGVTYKRSNYTDRQWKEILSNLRYILKADAKRLGVKAVGALATISTRVEKKERKERKAAKPRIIQRVNDFLFIEVKSTVVNFKILPDDTKTPFAHVTKEFLNKDFPKDKYARYIISGDRPADNQKMAQLQYPNKSDRIYTPKNFLVFMHALANSANYAGSNGPIFIQLQKVRANQDKPQPLKLFENVNINCVIQACIKALPEKKLDKKLIKYAEEKRLINRENPCTQETLQDLQKTFKISFIVYSATGNIWYETDPQNKRKYVKVKLFAFEDHASIFTPLEKVKKVVYEEPHIFLEDNHCFQVLTVKSTQHNSFEITSVRVSDTIVKSFKPSLATGNEADNSNPLFFKCTDEQQVKFTKWKTDNNLRALQEPYFEIFRQADSHLTTQQFSDYSHDETMWCCDQNRAYPSFKTNPLYDQFKLIFGYVSLYDTKDEEVLKVISQAGASLVTKVTHHNTFLESTGKFHANQWYNHILLFAAVTEGWIIVEISQSVICKNPEDIEFPFGENKYENNSFIGRLISGGKSSEFKRIFRSSVSDLPQLCFDLHHDKDCTGFGTWEDGNSCDKFRWIEGTFKCAETKSQLYHIHSCIIAYQQVSILQEMIDAAAYTQIVAYNTDGFFAREEITRPSSTVFGQFKVFRSNIKFDSSFDKMVHIPALQVENAPPWSLFSNRMTHKTLTIGPAGCGKSYNTIEKYPKINSVVCLPTNELVMNTKTTTKKMTVHRFFLIGVSLFVKQEIAENIIVDEVSMIPQNIHKIIEATCLKYRMNLDLIGDVNPGNEKQPSYQRLPVQGAARWEYDGYTIVPETSEIRRQNLDDATWLDSLRGLSQKKQIAAAFTKLKQAEFDPQDFTAGISSTHKNIHEFHTKLLRLAPQIVPARLLKSKTRNGEVLAARGQMIEVPTISAWAGRKKSDEATPSGFKYELAYFRTADAVQGATIRSKLWIDSDTKMENFFYTALTRCASLEDVTLISVSDGATSF